MNDRFRFRFWFFNNVEQKWLCINSDFVTTDGSAIPYDNGEGGATTIYDRDYICEQCTGLKDKNGKLIYEGDILDNISIDEQYEVKWDEDTARFCCITDNEIYDFDNFDVTAFEILGNIHENADLLEAKDD